MSKYDVDNVNDIDDLPDGKKNLAISGLLFGLTYLTAELDKSYITYILKTTHTTRSLEAMIAAASMLIPITLGSVGIAELIIALYYIFKKRKKGIKHLSLTKE